MKKYLVAAGWMVLVSSQAFAGEMPKDWTPPEQSAELQRVKSLEGVWAGEGMGHSGKIEPIKVSYRTTSAGTTVVETLDPGGPHEMISMYHDVNGKLSMTHYCSMGNQPQMELKDSSATKLDLAETDASKALLNGQMRMGSLVIETPDANTLIQTWTSTSADGKPMEGSVFTYKKV